MKYTLCSFAIILGCSASSGASTGQSSSEMFQNETDIAEKKPPVFEKPPAEFLLERVDKESVQTRNYFSFGESYFRLWGGTQTGSQPKGTSISPDGLHIYVTNFGFHNRDNVWRYNSKTLELESKVSFKGNAIESVSSKDSSMLYVSNFHHHEMLALDGTSLEVKGRFKVGNIPKHFALSPDESMLYVSNWKSDTVSFVDVAKQKVVKTIRVGVHPRGTAVTSDNKKLYVTNFSSASVSVIDLKTRKVKKTIKTARSPRHLVVSKDNSRVFVSCYGGSQVYIIDTKSDKVTKKIKVGNGPKTIELSQDEKFFYTADYRGSTMTIGNIETGEVLIVPVPTVKTSGLAVSPDDRRIYLTGWDSKNLLVFERFFPGDPIADLGPKPPGAVCYRKNKRACRRFP